MGSITHLVWNLRNIKSMSRKLLLFYNSYSSLFSFLCLLTSISFFLFYGRIYLALCCLENDECASVKYKFRLKIKHSFYFPTLVKIKESPYDNYVSIRDFTKHERGLFAHTLSITFHEIPSNERCDKN